MGTEASQRGPEVAKQCAWLITGIAVAYWVRRLGRGWKEIILNSVQIDFGTTRSDSQASWRFPIAFQSFFAIISGSCLLFLPDTPRWYYARDRIQEGDIVLALLNDRPLEDPHVQEQKRDILRSIQMEAEDENKLSLLSLVWDNAELRVGRRIRISFLILSIQQMMGMWP